MVSAGVRWYEIVLGRVRTASRRTSKEKQGSMNAQLNGKENGTGWDVQSMYMGGERTAYMPESCFSASIGGEGRRREDGPPSSHVRRQEGLAWM